MKTLISSLIAIAFTVNGLWSCTSRAFAEPMPNRTKISVDLDGAELDITIKAVSFERLEAIRRLVIDKLGAKSSAIAPTQEPETIEPVEAGTFKWQSKGFSWVGGK